MIPKLTIKNRFLITLALISSVSLASYFVFRLNVFFAYNYGPFGNFFGVLLILAEGHSILQSMGFLSSIIRINRPGALDHRRVEVDPVSAPSVTIVVPGRNEPREILEMTFISLISLNYRNKKIVFLDGSDPALLHENRRLAEKYGIEHYYPQKIPRSKAEIINGYLPRVKSKYFSVFDADQNPMPDFLTETVTLAEVSEKICFVQTPQLYSNLNVSPIALGAALQQSIFFESICEAKGTSNAMFCCGTNFLMRTAILKEVGGFDEDSVTEDFSTSVRMHSLGYRSVYFNHVRVFGMAPETLPAYLKQQFRWASGTVGVVRRIFLMIISGKLRLSPIQLWEYFLSGTYYFTGWSFFILMLCPALFLIFGIPSYFANPYYYIGTFFPYYIMTLTTFYATMRKRNYRIRDVFIGMIMGSLSFPILIKATIFALFNIKVKFQITEKSGGGRLATAALWPWHAMVALNLTALLAGFYKLPGDTYAYGINMLWCSYHLFLLLNIYLLNTRPSLKKKSVLRYI